MRFTVIDHRGRISFIAPCSTLEALVAACSTQPRTLAELLTAAEPFIGELTEHVHSALAVFDEHNSPGNPAWIHAALNYLPAAEAPVFRVIDSRTEDLSLTPVRAGVVVFNLLAKRIVQIQNTYAEIRRRGRVRVLKNNNRLTESVHRYELPADWSLVPQRS
jgi:hypothetical protein